MPNLSGAVWVSHPSLPLPEYYQSGKIKIQIDPEKWDQAMTESGTKHAWISPWPSLIVALAFDKSEL